MLTGRQSPIRTVDVELSKPYGEDSDDGAGVFGRTSRKQTTQQAPPDAIIKATTRIAEIDTAIEKINTKIITQQTMAIDYRKRNNKQKAIHCMRKKQLYEAELRRLESSKSKLQKQIDEINTLREINKLREISLRKSANASDKGKTISELSPTGQGVLPIKSARKNSIRTRPWESYDVKPNLLNSTRKLYNEKPNIIRRLLKSAPPAQRQVLRDVNAPLTLSEQHQLADLMRVMGQEDKLSPEDEAELEKGLQGDHELLEEDEKFLHRELGLGGTRKRRKHRKHKKKH